MTESSRFISIMSYVESGHVTNESCHISINDSYHIYHRVMSHGELSGCNLQIRHLMYACTYIYKREYKYAYESNKQIRIYISCIYIDITIYLHMTVYIYILVYIYIRQLYTYTQHVYTCYTYITYIHVVHIYAYTHMYIRYIRMHLYTYYIHNMYIHVVHI